MTLHLRPIEALPRKKCDTRALESARANVIADLTSTKLEKEIDARMPKHFAERQSYLQQGGK